MKRCYVFCALLSCLLSAAAVNAAMTEIAYETFDLGAGRWQYTYNVSNVGLEVDQQPASIEELTIWFDDSLYDSLVVTTQAPLSTSWDEIILQTEPVLHDPGAYDALVLSGNTGIGAGESLNGFSVAFDWLGAGTPGSQYYEIVDPDTFATIDADFTIPEPVTVLLLGLGAVTIRKRK